MTIRYSSGMRKHCITHSLKIINYDKHTKHKQQREATSSLLIGVIVAPLGFKFYSMCIVPRVSD